MYKLSRYVVYLFDGDGPLINSAEPALTAVNQVLESFELPPINVDAWRERNTGDLRRFYASLGIPLDSTEEARRRYRAFFNGMKHMVTEPAEAVNALRALRSRRIGVVTSMSRKSWEDYAERFGYDEFVGVAVTRDDCDDGKPSPKPLYLAMEMLGVPKRKIRDHEVRGVMVGDSVMDVVAGRAAGLDTAAIAYEGSYNNRERLLASRPTFMVPHIGIITDRRALGSYHQTYE